jgi:NAD(P)-dependent dehydrogenase (short-subunit alcohol dehydrogenase family)
MQNKNLLIIGASSSIGNSIINKFDANGYDVISTFSSNKIVNSKTLENFQLDLTSDNSIKLFSEDLNKIIDSIDALIFLSGILPGKNLYEYSMDDINKVFSINIIGQIKLMSKLQPMIGSKACILMMSSISAQRGSFDPIYSSSKAAILGFVKSMMTKLPKGSRINAIAPGLIEQSAMFNDMDNERQQFHRNQTHSGNLLSSLSLANMIFDLCQDHWSHLNGACIDLNGGQNVR